MDREEQTWIMLASAALAGGMKAKDAIATADLVSKTAKSRFGPSAFREED